MHSFILFGCSLAALLVAMTGWSRIRKPDIFLPATSSGLYLAEKGDLRGLRPKVENRLLLGGLGTGVGVLVGPTTWRIALLGAPGLHAFMTNLKTGPNSGLYTALPGSPR